MNTISYHFTSMFTDSSVNALLSNLRNYSDREIPKTPEIEALRKLDRDAILDRSWWQRFFNPTKDEILEMAEPNPVERLIMSHPELVLGPASLGLSSLRTAGALALQRVAPRALALGSVAPLWENLTNYMKGGKDAVKRSVSSDPAPRIQNTPQSQKNFVDRQQSLGNWDKITKRIGGRETWYDKIKNLYYTKDTRHFDIEVWKVTGKKAYHQGSMETISGRLYKGASHAPQDVL